MKLNFQQDVLVLPEDILSHCKEAGETHLRVLLWLASDLSLAQKTKQLCRLAECDEGEAKEAIFFWQEKGILISGSEKSVPAMAVVDEPKKKESTERVKAPKVTETPRLRRADELPNYTSVELAELMEKRREMRELIDEAQRILGKMFNPSEVNILVGMVDYLGMSEECILLLLAHCQKIEKKSLRAIEKYALHLADKGVVSFEAMEEEIRIAEAMYTFEGQVRSLFGLGKRALTTKERKMLSAWVSFGYGIEIVRIAYEMTANATGEASLPYANSILERWNAEGLRDVKAIEAFNEQARAKREGKKGGGTGLGNSFETDDFFEAALRRSFADRKES